MDAKELLAYILGLRQGIDPKDIDALLQRFSIIPKGITIQTYTINATSGVKLPAGVYIVQQSTDVQIQFYDSASARWVTAGNGGLIISDGNNVQLYNTNTVSVSVTVAKLEF